MKMSQLKMAIREVVREEIRIGLKEIIGEMSQPTKQVVRKPQPTKKQNISKNPVLNEILNETAASDEWKTMGGGTYDSGDMGDVLKSSYGKMMSDDSDNSNGTLAAEMGVNPNDAPNFLKKDYRKLMSAVDKKQGK